MYQTNAYNQPTYANQPGYVTNQGYDPNQAYTNQGYTNQGYLPNQGYVSITQPYQHTATGGYQNVNTGYQPTDNVPKEDDHQKFHSTGYRDLIWAIFFLLHFGGIAAIIVTGISQKPMNGTSLVSTDVVLNFSHFALYMEIAAIILGVALLSSIIYIQLLKSFVKPLIYIGMVVNVLSLGFSIIFIALKGNPFYAFFPGIFLLFLIFYYWTIRNRIDFAAEVIKSVVTVLQIYPSLQVISYVSLILQIGWIILWAFALVLSLRFSKNLAIVALVFLLFSLYWVSEVIKNVVHVTVSGVVASVYFLGDRISQNPSLDSLKRGMTTSFGSICLGSLIVSLIKTLRSLVRMMRTERDNILLCFIDCCLSWIDSLVQYFNHYAYCQVAIYGKTFLESSKDTWRLFKTAGLEAIINDNLVDGALWVGVFANGLICAGVGFAVVYLLTLSSSMSLVFLFIGFLMGFVIMIQAMQIIDSGVACTFVCFAENREALRNTNPTLYDNFVRTYNLY